MIFLLKYLYTLDISIPLSGQIAFYYVCRCFANFLTLRAGPFFQPHHGLMVFNTFFYVQLNKAPCSICLHLHLAETCLLGGWPLDLE